MLQIDSTTSMQPNDEYHERYKQKKHVGTVSLGLGSTQQKECNHLDCARLLPVPPQS